jgi:hypothetical protein
MADRWLEDSGFSFDCEEVGPIDVIDPSTTRKAETLAFVGIEDEAAVDSFDTVLAVCPRGLAFNSEGFELLSGEGGKRANGAADGADFWGRVYLGLVVGWRRCHDSKHQGSES